MLEVDLEYPKHLHKSHNDYPLAPEKLVVKEEWLSEHQTALLENKSMINITKLVPNLTDKNKYVVHYKNLMLYLSLGMKLKRIYRVLEFEEKSWMEPYIRLNTELRKKAVCIRKRLLQTDEQLCLWKNIGEPPQKSRHKISQNRRQLK